MLPAVMRRLQRCALFLCCFLLLSACGPRGAEQYNEGVRQFKQKKYKEAISAFEKTVKSNPDFPEAYLSIGLCYYHMKEYDKAQSNTEKGIALLDSGKSVDTADKWTPTQKKALGYWHLGLISEDRYRQAITKDNKAAVKHLKQARSMYQKAAELDSGNDDYGKRVKLTDEMLKKMGT